MSKIFVLLLSAISFVKAYHPTVGMKCASTDQCFTPYELCSIPANATLGKCVHKELYPLEEVEFGGFIVVFAIIWLANMGGIGGGGMVIPIAMLLLRFDANNSIALSNFSIFLSSIIRYWMNRHKPHPLR
jgi:uncharacterized membrane protein YfcA